MTAHSSPTIGETAIRAWNGLPPLLKLLIPSLTAFLIVIIPANFIVRARLYEIASENLRAQHQAILTELTANLEQYLATRSLYLAELAERPEIKACASAEAKYCADQSQRLFGAELNARLRDNDAYFVEIGFLNPEGKETARALRGSGSIVQVPGNTPLFEFPGAGSLQGTDGVYIFPISRDLRIPQTEAYQQPVVRFAHPVVVNASITGYVTVVFGVDDLFTRLFAPGEGGHIYMLNAERCLLASSDNTLRPALYKTWSGAAERTCYSDLPTQEWDVTVQNYRDTVFSTHVIHGALTLSGQMWTVVVQQSVALAYEQTNALYALLVAVNFAMLVTVVLLLLGADRVIKRFADADRVRAVAHARETRYNPYIVGAPVEDHRLFFGRASALAQVIGLGAMGGDDVLIVGDPYIGKTSLLRQIERRLRGRSISDPTYWYWPVLFDCQGIPANVFYASLMATILRSVEAEAGRMDLRYHQTANPGDYAVTDFREDINEVIELPNAAGKQARLVICLDNAHYLLETTLGYTPAFRESLRRLFTNVGPYFKLIAASLPTDEPLFDVTVAVVQIGLLSPEDAGRLMREPVADFYSFHEEALAYILAQSDLMPLELQRLSHQAVQVMLEQEGAAVTRGHAERALNRLCADLEPTFRAALSAVDAGTRNALFNHSNGRVTLTNAEYALQLKRAHVLFTDSGGYPRLTSLFMASLARQKTPF